MRAQPITPTLPAPRRINFAQVSRWVRTKVFGSSGHDTMYADNTPGFQTEFSTEYHRKYNAQCYFREQQNENASSAYERSESHFTMHHYFKRTHSSALMTCSLCSSCLSASPFSCVLSLTDGQSNTEGGFQKHSRPMMISCAVLRSLARR